ncbi:MAG: glycosyltransferase family 2 protein, partial [Xanthobacteraceae bacterium]
MSKPSAEIWPFEPRPGPQSASALAAPKVDGRSLDELASGEVKLPLASLVLINFNYAQFVGAAIDSIRAQDYPRLEVAVIDNASTDNSREVIAKHVGGDARFKIIHADRNEFVMGAALRGLAATSGEFVGFIDADDCLFSNFVSTHVQVHLALPRSVAFTSSNVVEIAADGAMLAGGRKQVAYKVDPAKRGLRPGHSVPRLATIPDDAYERLGSSVVSLSHTKKGWLWSTGSANFYRRSLLEFARPRCGVDALNILSADGYFARFCHWLAGSAMIERPLSAYRIHGANLFGQTPSMTGFLGGTGRAENWLPRRRRELLRAVLERADEISKRTEPGRFWGILDQAIDALR